MGVEYGGTWQFVQVEGIVLKLFTPEVDKKGVADPRGAHVMDDLRPFDLRERLDRLKLDNVLAMKTGEVGAGSFNSDLYRWLR